MTGTAEVAKDEGAEKSPAGKSSTPDDSAKPRGLMSNLIGALQTLLITSLFGGTIAGAISYEFTEFEKERTDKAQRILTSQQSREELLKTFSDTFGSRRVNVSLVASAIQHDAPMDELKARWNAYQQSYVQYNLFRPRYRAALLKYLGGQTFNLFAGARSPMDKYLTRSFGRVDACLTDAYYLRINETARKAKAMLGSCWLKRSPPSGKVPTHWAIADEIDKLNSCLDSYEIEAMFAIYVEDKFDDLSPKEQVPDQWKTQWWDFFGKPNQDTLHGCPRAADWGCLRVHNRPIIAGNLKSSCSQLEESGYFTDAPVDTHKVSEAR
jgi:hypothetical protein